MQTTSERPAPAVLVIIAFGTVYLVWGSTYFFIRLSVEHIPPMLVGVLRYLTAGGVLLAWCLFTGKPVFSRGAIGPAFVSGFLLLCGGNGILIWSEQYVPSSLAAILLASGPIWFVVLDRRMWRENFRSRSTIAGLIGGFAGVLLLFAERLGPEKGVIAGAANAGGGGIDAGGAGASVHGGAGASGMAGVHGGAGAHGMAGVHGGAGAHGMAGVHGGAGAHDLAGMATIALGVLVIGSISWAAGSLYSKYRSASVSNPVNAGWQMLLAGLVFLPASLLSGEWSGFHLREVPLSSWLAIAYLVIFGSLIGYSAFTWLLQVRPATQVSTHAYVNPVVAVLLGVWFAGERMTPLQLLGLAVILSSVLMINLAKYRRKGVGSARRKGLEAPAPKAG